MMAGVWQPMEKCFLELTAVQRCINLILKHLKVCLFKWRSFILFLSLFMYANLVLKLFVFIICLVFHGIYVALFVVAVSKHVVYYKGHQVYNLNELEYINGEVWANVLPVCLYVFHYNFNYRKYISTQKIIIYVFMMCIWLS